MVAEVRAPRGANPIWLFPSAMTFIAFYKDVLEFGQLLAAFCRQWLDFFREIWTRAFALAPAGSPLSLDAAAADLLTLWATSSLAIWLFPLIAGTRDGRVKTTVDALRDSLRLPTLPARLIAFLLIAGAIVLIAAPFGLLSDPQNDSTLMRTLQESQILLTEPAVRPPSWLAWGLIALGAVLLSYVFFVIGPRLEATTLTPEERRDLVIIAVVLWTLSAALLAAALAIPAEGLALPGFQMLKPDAMVLSLLALIGLVAWRSALPFVQLALLIGAVFAIDAGLRFVLDVWSSVQT